jgi:thiaminase
MNIIKCLEVDYNVRMDKIYYHRLNFNYQDGSIVELEVIGVPKLKQYDEIYKVYEEQKRLFQKDLYQEMVATLESKEMGKESQDNKRFVALVTDAYNKGYKTYKDLSEYLGVNPRMLAKRGVANLIMELNAQTNDKKQI